MSFLVLAFRKMSLKRQINNGNFKLMNISMHQQSIQNKISALEDAKSTLQTAWDSVMAGRTSRKTSIFSQELAASQNAADTARTEYESMKNDSSIDPQELAAAEQRMKDTEAAYNQKSKEYMQQVGSANADDIALQQAANQMFEQGDKAQLNALHKQDKQYDLQKESLNTQMTAWNSEYSNLDKSVSEAAKNAAPEYVP